MQDAGLGRDAKAGGRSDITGFDILKVRVRMVRGSDIIRSDG